MTAVDYINDPARLQEIIRDAIKALDEGRRGDVRRILTTGRADAVKAGSCVIAKDARQ